MLEFAVYLITLFIILKLTLKKSTKTYIVTSNYKIKFYYFIYYIIVTSKYLTLQWYKLRYKFRMHKIKLQSNRNFYNNFKK